MIRFLAVLGRLLPIIVCCGCIGLDDRSVALPLLGDHCGGFCIIFFGDSHEFANSEFILASGMYGRILPMELFSSVRLCALAGVMKFLDSSLEN